MSSLSQISAKVAHGSTEMKTDSEKINKSIKNLNSISSKALNGVSTIFLRIKEITKTMDNVITISDKIGKSVINRIAR